MLQTAVDANLLERIATNVAEYREHLPSITADEAIASDFKRMGIYRAHGKATAMIRVLPGHAGSSIREVRTYRTMDGKVVPEGKQVSLPFTMNSAFTNVSAIYFDKFAQSCLTYSFLPASEPSGAIEILFRTPDTPRPECHAPAGRTDSTTQYFGKALVDAKTAQIRHLERTLTKPPEGTNTSVNFISVDYAPAPIGDLTFWLPTRIQCELRNGDGHFDATYSNYHRYTGAVTIVPDSITPAGDTP